MTETQAEWRARFDRREFRVGDKLVLAGNTYGRRETPHTVQITKIGRKWMYFGNSRSRASMETLVVDGGEYTSPGKLWFSSDEYEAWTSTCHLMNELQGCLTHRPNPGVTADNIRAAAKLLRVEIETK